MEDDTLIGVLNRLKSLFTGPMVCDMYCRWSSCSCQCDDAPPDPREWCVNVHRSVRLLYTMTDPSVTRLTHLLKIWPTKTVIFDTPFPEYDSPEVHAPEMTDIVTVLLIHMGLWCTCVSVLWLTFLRLWRYPPSSMENKWPAHDAPFPWVTRCIITLTAALGEP